MITVLKAANKTTYINPGYNFSTVVVFLIYVCAALLTIIYGFPNYRPSFSYYTAIDIKPTGQQAIIIETQADRAIKVHSTIRDLDLAFQPYLTLPNTSVNVG